MSQIFDLWLPLDKPTGMTSHDVVAIARKRLNMRKIGHTGTLDPDATGLLVLALGKATRLIQYLAGEKVYWARIKLGESTDTQDASGKVLKQTSVPELTLSQLENQLQKFRGEINQLPPMVSAVSYQGQRLYKLARQGIEIPERPRRQVTISQLRLLTWESPELEIEVSCSAGTYIRTLAHDLGDALGCGAHLLQLRRLAAHGLNSDSLGELGELSPSTLSQWALDLDAPLQHLPKIQLAEKAAWKFSQGQTQSHAQLPSKERFRVYSEDGQFLGLGEKREPDNFKPCLTL